MNRIRVILTAACVMISSLLTAQILSLKDSLYEISFSESGSVTKLTEQGNNVEFRKDSTYTGPSIYSSGKRIRLEAFKSSKDTLIFKGEDQNLLVSMRYWIENKSFAIQVFVKNKSVKIIQVNDLMLRLGINTEMDTYPHWHQVFFPTMMRCEKNFFWGYLMNPDGKIITVVSPDPVA